MPYLEEEEDARLLDMNTMPPSSSSSKRGFSVPGFQNAIFISPKSFWLLRLFQFMYWLFLSYMPFPWLFTATVTRLPAINRFGLILGIWFNLFRFDFKNFNLVRFSLGYMFILPWDYLYQLQENVLSCCFCVYFFPHHSTP